MHREDGSAPDDRARTLRVVVADDDPAFLHLVATLIEQDERVEVVGLATDGEEAVQLAGWQDPDIVLMDVNMPRLDGLRAAKLVTETRPRVCVLMISGDDAIRPAEAADAGAAGVIVKGAPLALVDLLVSMYEETTGTSGRLVDEVVDPVPPTSTGS